MVEKYVEKVIHADGTTETGEFEQYVNSYAYIFYSDGTGFERSGDDEYVDRIQYSISDNRLTVSYIGADPDHGSIVFEVSCLSDSNVVLESSETESGDTYIATATFKKVHSGVITLKEMVRKWIMGSLGEEPIYLEIFEDGKGIWSMTILGFTTNVDYDVSVSSHTLTLTNKSESIQYDLLCFAADDIQLLGSDSDKPFPLIRVEETEN